MLSGLPFFTNYSPVSDKLLVRPSIRFRSVSHRTTPIYLLQAILLMDSKYDPHRLPGPLLWVSHMTMRGDHLLVLRRPMNDTAQPPYVLSPTNGSNGHWPATTRPPYKLRWRGTARKWKRKSGRHSDISVRVSLFGVEQIRNSMSNRRFLSLIASFAQTCGTLKSLYREMYMPTI